MRKFKMLIVAFIVITSSAFTIQNETMIVKDGYKVGDIATDFNLKNIDGKMMSLADFKTAKGFIIIFTCNTCPVSVRNEDRILALDKKYKNLGYPVIAINPNNPTPHTYILKKEKEGLRVKYIGGIDDSSRNAANVKTKYVEEAVDALLANKPVKVTATRAIGCSIKV